MIYRTVLNKKGHIEQDNSQKLIDITDCKIEVLDYNSEKAICQINSFIKGTGLSINRIKDLNNRLFTDDVLENIKSDYDHKFAFYTSFSVDDLQKLTTTLLAKILSKLVSKKVLISYIVHHLFGDKKIIILRSK